MKRARPRALPSGSTSRIVSLPEARRRVSGLGVTGVGWARRGSGCLAAALRDASLNVGADATGFAGSAGVEFRPGNEITSRAEAVESVPGGAIFWESRVVE